MTGRIDDYVHDELLIELARQVHHVHMGAEARRLLGKVPVPFAVGFILHLPLNVADAEVHRECFARLNDARVGAGLERVVWNDILSEWPKGTVCHLCGKVQP